MRECWNQKPAARLPMLRVKKTLSQIRLNMDHKDLSEKTDHITDTVIKV